MTVDLSGPVGLRWRSTNVTNRSADQMKIIGLLGSISNSEGGKMEDWTVQPLAGPNGVCPKPLADAIWDFQSFWKARGVFHNIDGVADPGGNTLKHLNMLAPGGGGGRLMPVDPLPPKPSPPNKPGGIFHDLLVRMTPRPTNWKIAGTATVSVSATIEGAPLAAATGTITLSNTRNPGSAVPLKMRGAGLSFGPDAIPGGLEFAPASFPSVGSQIQAGPRTTTTTLALDDLLGICLLLGISLGAGVWPNLAQGGNATVILFNIGSNRSLMTLPQDLLLLMSGPSSFVVDSFNSCKAWGCVLGQFAGFSVGVSLLQGWLNREGADIRPDPDVRSRVFF